MSIESINKPDYQYTRLIIVMGTTGCGKSTIAEGLSVHLNAAYLEGDDFHSTSNKTKMASGIALNDEDRWPWLEALTETMRTTSGKTVASCSSLKRSYRDFITKIAGEPVLFVHLNGSKALLASRLAERQGHFMNISLLESQLDTLELPQADEFSFTIDIDASVSDIIETIVTTILN